MQKRITEFAQKLAKKPNKAKTNSSAAIEKAKKSYGTFSKNVKEFVPVFDAQSEFVSEMKKPEIFAVIVEMEKFTKDGKEQDSDEDEVEDVEPVSTPQPGFSFIHVFKSNTWWLKGNTDKWYPYEHYFAKLNGLSNKRERIFGLWANLVAPRKKPLSKRWNDGDAAIESQVKNEIRPVLKGPVDENWELPLWLRAQAFRLMLCGNPYQKGIRNELFDADLNKFFDSKKNNFQKTPNFLFVETVKKFERKVRYPKPEQYKRIVVE